MYYNIDIKTGDSIQQIIRKVSKVTETNLKYYIDLYLTDNNQVIVTKYQQ